MSKNRDSCCGHDDSANNLPHEHSSAHHHSHDEHEGHQHDREHTHDDHDGHSHGDGEFNLHRELIIVSIVASLLVVGIIWQRSLQQNFNGIGEYLILIPAYLLSGWQVLTSAGRNIIRGRFFDETFLMTIATLGALAIHQLPEAVGVMLFYRVGELCQDYAVNKSRRSIRSLLEIRPDRANLINGNEIITIAPDRVKVGDLILIKPGEKVPLDGEVIEGDSYIDTSALTGESTPRSISPGKTVLAGTLNQSGALTVKVSKLFAQSSISRILELVENASQKKAATQKFITTFAKTYTPIVVLLSLAVAILPPFFIPGAGRLDWVYRALILLVISCPCGLVISIPLGYFGGIGGAAKRGILIKGSTYLDTLTQVKTVVFDKTGTLTQGVFKVTEIVPARGYDREELLELAAQVESRSQHPIAISIRQAYGRAVDRSLVKDYQEIAGYGVCANIDGRVIIAGNDRFLTKERIDFNTPKVNGTVVYLAVDGEYTGYLKIADEIKPDALAAIAKLKQLGITRTIMLTGDSLAVAGEISWELGLDEYQAELLPEDKLAALERIIDRIGGKHRIMMVGDGINDAPTIARADVGVAMGGLGSDAAIETADVVIMNDSPTKLAQAIEISHKTRQIVWQNIIFALVVKGVFIALGIFGVATMWEAVFADVGVALIAIGNSTRVMR
jgi:Zn2+/Cd2+-exporting ATPase